MARSKIVITGLISAVAVFATAALLVSIFERRQEARSTYFKVVEIEDGQPDPAVWGRNFPAQYEGYLRTMRTSELVPYSRYGRFGGSEAFSRLDRYPDLRRLFAGYAFAVEYREDEGHLKALEDMLASKRLGDAKPGTCLTCKSSEVPAIMKAMDGPDRFYATPLRDLMARFHPKFSIACADCHDARTQALRISRPAFREAMDGRGIDVDKASHQEMKAYVCAQCHVEYYFKGPDKRLTHPWAKGLAVEAIEGYYDEIAFKDWEHGETGTPLVKIQHPEFELWSSGIHARSAVSCADCHMPYKKEGAVKISDHWVRSPLVNLTNACVGCHRLPETELQARVLEVQERTYELLERADRAIIAAQDALKLALERGVAVASLAEARALHRRAFLRWDFLSAENSMGFHSPQEAVRILGDSVDFARQAELAAYRALWEKTPPGGPR